MNPPLPSFEIKGMLGSLTGYKETEEQTQEKAIYECCTLLQTDISAKDIMEHVFPEDRKKKAIVNKYLAQFHKEGKLVRKGRGRYDLKEKVEWTDEVQETAPECKYSIPYFDDLAYFHSGDIILIGGKTGEGKTHIAMNFIKQFKTQGIKPFYISLESGSRHEKVATQLGLNQKDYYVSKEAIDNPLQMEIEENSVTIIDWLYTGEDFAATQSIFKHLSDEMKRKGGSLIVFTQLKENYDWFAVNLIKSFARFAARFVYDDTDGVNSHFDVCKITDPKGHYSNAIVSTQFNFDTKELTKKLNI
jgi:DNA replication protein DnaC